jgi:hypothetical protein
VGEFAITIVALLFVALIAFRRGPDRQVSAVPRARLLRWAALVPLVLEGLIFLVFAVGESVGGDLSGAGHLIQLALLLPVGWLLWTRPLEAGAALVAGGLISAVLLLLQMPRDQGAVLSPAIAILALPQVVAGVLGVLAGLVARKGS